MDLKLEMRLLLLAVAEKMGGRKEVDATTHLCLDYIREECANEDEQLHLQSEQYPSPRADTWFDDMYSIHRYPQYVHESKAPPCQ